MSSERDPDKYLIYLCGAFILVDLAYLLLGLASIPAYLVRIRTLSIPDYGIGVGNTITNASVAAGAAARGLSLSGYAWYLLVLDLAAGVVFTAVGVLVLWRARTHWFGWFTAHVMLFLNSYAFYQPQQAALIVPAWVIDAGSILWPTFILYLFLFPNGRVVPGWMRWPIAAYAFAHALFQLTGVLIQAGLIPAGDFNGILIAFEAGIVGVFLLVLGSQIYRYSRVSTAVERAQTRWFILGIAVFMGLPSLGNLAGFGRLFDSDEWGTLSLTIIPVTLAIAILRYRLWDIDVIIRRTLQYSFVTALLAAAFFGGIVVLQGIFVSLTGDPNSPLVTVLSTLGIAALFSPLRRRVQAFIDRRFYRRKYDAEKTLADFSTASRDEVDLDRLAAALSLAVLESLSPDRVTLQLAAPKLKHT